MRESERVCIELYGREHAQHEEKRRGNCDRAERERERDNDMIERDPRTEPTGGVIDESAGTGMLFIAEQMYRIL